MEKRQGVIRGAVTLTVAVGFVKVLGALFKIPLANLLGGEGMGVFSTAYGLFGPMYAVTVGGFPVALSALVARYRGSGRPEHIRIACRGAWLLFGGVGLLGSALIWLLAEPFCAAAGNPGAVWCVRMTAPALFGCCAMSVWRGCCQGLGNMTPTAVSQVVEAAVKVALGLGGAVLVQRMGLEAWGQTGMVWGVPAGNAEEAARLLLPYMAAGATGGVTLSTFAGLLCLCVYRCTPGGRLSVPLRAATPLPGIGEVFSRLLRTALPICLGAAAVSLTTLVDLFTVMNRLRDAVSADPAAFAGCGLPPEQLPNFLYGSYQGMTVSLYLLIPTLTASFGVSALPAVAEALASGRRDAASRQAASVLRAVLLLAVPAGVGLTVLAEPLLTLLYPARAPEVAVAASSLRVLGIAGICLGIASPVNSLLQAAGKPMTPVWLLCVGAGIKLCLNLLLIGRTELNILGAALGSLACNAFLMVAGLICLRKTLPAPVPAGQVLIPLLAGGCCCLSALLTLRSLPAGTVGTLCAVAVGGLVYLLCVLVSGGKKIHLLLKNSTKSKNVSEKTQYM